MNAFVINETVHSRRDLGLRITKPPAVPPAQRIIKRIGVDGREGTLTILRGWEDTTFEIGAALLGADIRSHYHEILPELLSAATVYFSNEPAVYYKVKTVEASPLTMTLRSLGEFTLTFTCAPFRYLRNVAAVTMTATGQINNIGTVYSLPKIKVYGTGTRTLTINSKPIVLNIQAGNLTLDSELKECFFGDVAQNNRMSGDFPVFNVGVNHITLGSGITKIEIEPRWRQI